MTRRGGRGQGELRGGGNARLKSRGETRETANLAMAEASMGGSDPLGAESSDEEFEYENMTAAEALDKLEEVGGFIVGVVEAGSRVRWT